VSSESQVIDMVVSGTEVRSISEVASRIVQEILTFARKHGVENQFDPQRMEEDLIIFLAKRRILNLTELRVSVLDGEVEVGDRITGGRKADLIFRITYKEGVYRK